MLYLAYVKNTANPYTVGLELLANQQTNLTWTVCQTQAIVIDNLSYLNPGMFVLVTLGENQEIIDLKEAKEWVLNLINIYLKSENISPEVLEEWKRDLTAKNQELTQTRLELETRLEQLQELEENLKKIIKEQEK